MSDKVAEKAAEKAMRQRLAEDGVMITDDQERCLRITKIVFAVLLVLSAIAGYVAVRFWPEESTLKLMTTADYRESAVLDTDFYPEMVETLVGLHNLGVVAATISLVAGIMYGIGYAWNELEVEQMQRGANPYLWVNFATWHFLVFVLFAALAGVHNVFLLVLTALAVFSWLFVLWLCDLLNSYAYSFSTYGSKGTGAWSWLPVGFVFFIAIVVYVVLGFYIFHTFDAAAFDGPAIAQGYWLGTLIPHLALYLANPLIFVVYKIGWIRTIYMREMIYYIFNGVFAIAATWLTIALFIADSVTLP